MLIFKLFEKFPIKDKKVREANVTWDGFCRLNIFCNVKKKMFITVNVTCEDFSQSRCLRKIFNNKTTFDSKHSIAMIVTRLSFMWQEQEEIFLYKSSKEWSVQLFTLTLLSSKNTGLIWRYSWELAPYNVFTI